MRKVVRMNLGADSVTEFKLPHGAEFLSAFFQPSPSGTPVIALFALVDPSAPTEQHQVLAIVDGEEYPAEKEGITLRYVATCQAIPPSGHPYVVHLFEVL